MASRAKGKQLLYKILKRPGNRTCADCPARNPTWASTNLGVFFCIKCAGSHRKLGTHISKVRSVNLDSWSDAHIRSMDKMWGKSGNDGANAYYECTMPRGAKMNFEDDYRREEFIFNKYKYRRWYSDPNKKKSAEKKQVSEDEEESASSSEDGDDNNNNNVNMEIKNVKIRKKGNGKVNRKKKRQIGQNKKKERVMAKKGNRNSQERKTQIEKNVGGEKSKKKRGGNSKNNGMDLLQFDDEEKKEDSFFEMISKGIVDNKPEIEIQFTRKTNNVNMNKKQQNTPSFFNNNVNNNGVKKVNSNGGFLGMETKKISEVRNDSIMSLFSAPKKQAPQQGAERVNPMFRQPQQYNNGYNNNGYNMNMMRNMGMGMGNMRQNQNQNGQVLHPHLYNQPQRQWGYM